MCKDVSDNLLLVLSGIICSLVCSCGRSCQTLVRNSLKKLKTWSSDVMMLSRRTSSMKSSWTSCRSSLVSLSTFLDVRHCSI